MRTIIHKPMALLTLTLLTACGVSPQDSGTTSTLSGIAVDGYVAGATVYLDVNNNGKMDAFEPRALTDGQGRFGVSATGTNYCNSANANDAQYCLQTGVYSGSQIRIEGGLDTLTGRPFAGVLSRAADATSAQVTTPLTSLVGLMSSAQVTALLSAENLAAGTSLTAADLKGNPLAISTATSANQDYLIRTAWLLQKAVAIITAELKLSYTNNTAANQGLPFSLYVYQALVSAWNTAGMPDMQTFLGNATNINDLVTNASSSAEALIQAASGIKDGGAVASDIPTRIADLISLINNAAIFPEGSSAALTQSDVEARGRAIEVLTIMLSQAKTLSGYEATAITDLAANLSSLASAGVDLAQLATDYSGNTPTNYTPRNTLATALGNSTITATNPATFTDSGTGDTASLSIDTSTNTVSLDITADLTNSGTASTYPLTGTLTTINAYSSLMTVDVFGSPQSVILTTNAAGNLVIDTSTMNLSGTSIPSTFTL